MASCTSTRWWLKISSTGCETWHAHLLEIPIARNAESKSSLQDSGATTVHGISRPALRQILLYTLYYAPRTPWEAALKWTGEYILFKSSLTPSPLKAAYQCDLVLQSMEIKPLTNHVVRVLTVCPCHPIKLPLSPLTGLLRILYTFGWHPIFNEVICQTYWCALRKQ